MRRSTWTRTPWRTSRTFPRERARVMPAIGCGWPRAETVGPQRGNRCVGAGGVRHIPPVPTTRRCWKRQAVSTFHRRRRGGCPATRRWSRCNTAPVARSWTSAAGRGRSHPRCAGRWQPATGSAGSRDVRTAAAMPTTWSIGRPAARRRSTTWCCCAAGTTGRSTRKGSASRSIPTGTCSSYGRTAARSPRSRRRQTGRAHPSHQ